MCACVRASRCARARLTVYNAKMYLLISYNMRDSLCCQLRSLTFARALLLPGWLRLAIQWEEREKEGGGEREREMLASSSPFSWFPWWLAAHRSPARLSHWHGAACSAVINNWAPRAPRRGAGGSACPDAAEPGWPWEAVCYVTLLLRARTRGTSLCALPDSSSDLWELQGTLCACAEQLGRFKAPFFTSFFFFF